jgi:hypothetical protein
MFPFPEKEEDTRSQEQDEEHEESLLSKEVTRVKRKETRIDSKTMYSWLVESRVNCKEFCLSFLKCLLRMNELPEEESNKRRKEDTLHANRRVENKAGRERKRDSRE